MAAPSATLTDHWRAQATGVRKPTLTAEIRQGRFFRRYDEWDGDPIGGRIAGGNNAEPWQAFWTPSTAYIELPNVLSFKKGKDFANNGIAIGTIELENIVYEEQGAGDTLVHLLKRGALSPYRGYSAPDRPMWPAGYQDATWYRYLERNAQITIHEGYDGEEAKTWTGLIDDIDLTSTPDRITITARDFGQALSDQEMFGHNHDPMIREPVTFIDKRQAEKLVKVGYAAEGGTEAAHHPPSYVLDLDGATHWRSRTYNTPDATDFIQIRVPLGRYETFYLWPKDEGMEAYISVYVKPRADGKPNKWGDDELPDNGWVDMAGGVGGAPLVPGDLGGVPYVKLLPYLDNKGHYHVLPQALECGKGSIIRVSFRNLAPQRQGDMPPGEPEPLPYAARVTRMVAMKRNISKEAKEKHQVLVDDVSDAIRFILRWAGFKEWEIENTGVRLKKPVVIGRDSSLMDAINTFKEAVNFVFFMGDPTDDNLSIGVPIFRAPRVVTDDEPIAEVKDIDLLTGIRLKISDAPLAYVIRMRGRAVKADEPTAGTGFLFGGGDVRRVKFTYYPPWARDNNRLAGILKHVLHQDNKFETTEDCEFACYYTALQEALESVTGTIEAPGWPGFDLDRFVMVNDLGTGLRTRLWISNIESEIRSGERASYKVTLSGSWVDTPDVVAMKAVINERVRSGE